MKRQFIFTITCFFVFTLSGIPYHLSAQQTFSESGKCGYYADKYEGHATSNGEKYDKNALTCSHKTLPFGTKIRVTRLDNNKSVVVRVNDRGPFIDGYIVDISKAAANEIGLTSGNALVKIEIVESAESAKVRDAQTEAEVLGATSTKTITTTPASNQTGSSAKPVSNETATKTNVAPATSKVAPASDLYKVDITQTEKKGFGVQIISLSDANSVMPFMRELQPTYPGKVLVNLTRDEFNNSTYKVIIGPYPDKKSAEAARKTISQKFKKPMLVDLSDI